MEEFAMDHLAANVHLDMEEDCASFTGVILSVKMVVSASDQVVVDVQLATWALNVKKAYAFHLA